MLTKQLQINQLRMKSRYMLILVLFISTNIMSQNKDFAKLSKYSYENLRETLGSSQVMPNWIDGSDYFWYSFRKNGGNHYYIVDIKNKTKKEIFDNRILSKQINKITNKEVDENDLRLGIIKFKDYDTLTFDKDGYSFTYTIKDGKLYSRKIKNKEYTKSKRKSKPYWIKQSPDGKYQVYAYKHNLYMKGEAENTFTQITKSGEKFYSFSTNSQKDTERKNFPGINWGGNSKFFYSLRKDTRKIKEFWVINSLQNPRPSLRTYKFPMPGDKYVTNYELHIFYPENKKHIKLDIDKYKDQEVNIIYSDIDKFPEYIYFTRKNRTSDTIELCKINTKTAEISELIKEVSKPHLNKQLTECRILNGGEDIIWWSERSGWGQYYLYDKNGKLKNRITKGDFVACNISKIDTLGRKIIYQGYGASKNIDKDYRLFYISDLDRQGQLELTPTNAEHSINISDNFKYIVDNFSRVDMTPKSELRDLNGNLILKLEEVELSSIISKGWKFPKRVKIMAPDAETPLYGVMYTPFDIDTLKKYPIIANVYPGPQADFIPRTFDLLDNNNQALANLGAIVINIPSRGSSLYRGREFHSFGYGNLRDYALSDNKYIIEELSKIHKFIDTTRIGIYGHSGGGAMAAAAIMTYPNFYKVAVAASGNYDNNIYTKWWGETYHGLQYDKNGNLQKIPTVSELAKNLRGKLLLITGDVDVNVHPANTIRLINALMKEHKIFDFMLFPGVDHGMDSKYYNNLIKIYFYENLIGKLITTEDKNEILKNKY